MPTSCGSRSPRHWGFPSGGDRLLASGPFQHLDHVNPAPVRQATPRAPRQSTPPPPAAGNWECHPTPGKPDGMRRRHRPSPRSHQSPVLQRVSAVVFPNPHPVPPAAEPRTDRATSNAPRIHHSGSRPQGLAHPQFDKPHGAQPHCPERQGCSPVLGARGSHAPPRPPHRDVWADWLIAAWPPGCQD
jgi:hypothetical protein